MCPIALGVRGVIAAGRLSSRDLRDALGAWMIPGRSLLSLQSVCNHWRLLELLQGERKVVCCKGI